MKIYIEEHEDATHVYPWLSHTKSAIRCLCIVGEMLLFPEEIVQFKQKSSEMLRTELGQRHELDAFRFYLVTRVGNDFQSRRIFDYYKLWRLLEREEELRGFTSRMEIPVHIGEDPYYIGIAEFGIEQLPTAIALVSDDHSMYVISCAENNESSHCQKLLDQVLEIGLKEDGDLPIFEMVSTLTAKGYAVCTWGSSSEEQELQYFYSPQL
ncbi:hypothetical protein [Exiguobacterium sp. s166]|uniref:hypothetical protein n=1 Tax=Exiguobacterium sp. s166 TaxID=2751204 RepID=UPI001BE4E81D|nr:hypothetical protein [Exiguobacterium sp. s166]